MVFYILEFGGQHTDLIGNRLSEMGFPVTYADSDVKFSDITDASGIILSGGPKNLTSSDAYPYDPELFRQEKVPVLGICFGMQLASHAYGSRLHRQAREYGEAQFRLVQQNELFDQIPGGFNVWMNHGDSIVPNRNMTVLGYTEKGVAAAVKINNKPYYGVQFHPEVTHTQYGSDILRNFAGKICHCVPETTAAEGFDAGKFIAEEFCRMKHETRSLKAVVFASGGVDSTTAALLAHEAGVDTIPVCLEMGNGRKDEAAYVQRVLGQALRRDVMVHDRSGMFIRDLYGLHDPEEKRGVFQQGYMRTMEEIEMMFPDAVLIKGSIATDARESGKEAGKGKLRDKRTVVKIKSHHNVGAEEAWKGPKIMPLEMLTKDRVRQVARTLGVPEELAARKPFPGPGLFVRFVTGLYGFDAAFADNIDSIARHYGLNGYALPRKGVGLKGDERAFEHAVLLTGERNWDMARAASKTLIEDVDVCRVLYLPHEIGYERDHFLESVDYPMTRRNLDALREATDIVERTLDEFGVKPDQVPVISFGGPDGMILNIRDVNSRDFRTCRPLTKPGEFPWECYDEIDRRIGRNEQLGRYGTNMVALEVSDKPGGTTEWE